MGWGGDKGYLVGKQPNPVGGGLTNPTARMSKPGPVFGPPYRPSLSLVRDVREILLNLSMKW